MLTIHPPPRVLQVRDRGLAAVEHAGEIGADDAVPFVVRHLGDWHADANTGAVDEHIEAAEFRDDRLDRALHGRRVAHVAHDADDLRAAVPTTRVPL